MRLRAAETIIASVRFAHAEDEDMDQKRVRWDFAGKGYHLSVRRWRNIEQTIDRLEVRDGCLELANRLAARAVRRKVIVFIANWDLVFELSVEPEAKGPVRKEEARRALIEVALKLTSALADEAKSQPLRVARCYRGSSRFWEETGEAAKRAEAPPAGPEERGVQAHTRRGRIGRPRPPPRALKGKGAS